MTTAIAHRAIAYHLNQTCFCMTLDQDRLFNSLNTAAPGLLDWHSLSSTHPQSFCAEPNLCLACGCGGHAFGGAGD